MVALGYLVFSHQQLPLQVAVAVVMAMMATSVKEAQAAQES
jgi:hypothetical protein